MKKFVIFNLKETLSNDGEPMFWSDHDGWGDLSNATVYSLESKRRITHLPLRNSVWVELPCEVK